MKILLIEDEIKTVNYLKRGLSEQGWSVDSATDGLEGRLLATTKQYDAIILDIMLPSLDGINLLKSIRPTVKTPVIMLTAKDSVASRLEGFNAGADDYLVKPFSFLELVARLHAITQRVSSKEETHIYIGNLHIDLLSRRAYRGSRRLDLTAKEFSLLEVLAKRQRKLFPKPSLPNWSGTYVSTPTPMLSKPQSSACAPSWKPTANPNSYTPSAAWVMFWKTVHEKMVSTAFHCQPPRLHVCRCGYHRSFNHSHRALRPADFGNFTLSKSRND